MPSVRQKNDHRNGRALTKYDFTQIMFLALNNLLKLIICHTENLFGIYIKHQMSLGTPRINVQL